MTYMPDYAKISVLMARSSAFVAIGAESSTRTAALCGEEHLVLNSLTLKRDCSSDNGIDNDECYRNTQRVVVGPLSSDENQSVNLLFQGRVAIYRSSRLRTPAEMVLWRIMSSKVFKSVVWFQLLALAILVWSNSCLAAKAKNGPAPKSLMIQLSSWGEGPGSLRDWLDLICLAHRDPAKPGYIENLVLTDVALADPYASVMDPVPLAKDVLLTSRLNELLPYFPGGNGTCQFDAVFVGTVDLQGVRPPGADASWITYREGIKDPNFRANLLVRSKAIAAAFDDHVRRSATPNVRYHWYISQEAFLDFFTDLSIKDAYESYLIQHIKDLSAIRQPSAFLWSPGFAARPSQITSMSLLGDNLKSLFSAIPKAVRQSNTYGQQSAGPLWLHMQDHVGALGPHMPKEDARKWFFFLKQLNWFTSLAMNVEQFRVDAQGALVAGDRAEIMAREAYYQQQGIALGAAFELRYWGENNHP